MSMLRLKLIRSCSSARCSKQRGILVAALFVVLSSAGAAHAAATYTYSGNGFDTFKDTPNIPGQYTTSDSVQGFFTVADPLAGGLRGSNVTGSVQTFSFTDGRQTFTETSTLSRELFQISTDATGAIIAWNVILESRNQVHPLDTINTVFYGATVRDRGQQLFSNAIIDEGVISGSPGIWSVVIPEPGTALLFGLGLAGLASSRRSGGRDDLR